MKINNDKILEIAQNAGNKILEIYNNTEINEIEYKEDNSPLTKADKLSNDLIFVALNNLYNEIPIITEEGKTTEYNTRKNWNLFWLVDPLDGTKEFIKRNGEFTVNIGLVKDNYPIFGLIYAPVFNHFWFTTDDSAYKIENGITKKIETSNRKSDLVCLQSRSHLTAEDSEFYSKYDIRESFSIGSSLKFCMIAEGRADIYHRSGPTMEWDTCAGQAILEKAGGRVLKENGNRFDYNKKSLLNEAFTCLNY